MSDTNPPPGAPGANPEPPKPADAAQKKQTVRISLPPKPAGGPSIRLPAAGATPAPAAAPTAPRPAAPAPSSAPVMGISGQAKTPPPSTVSTVSTPAPKPAPVRSVAPVRASVSGLDVGLAFATVLCSLATAAVLFLNQPIQ